MIEQHLWWSGRSCSMAGYRTNLHTEATLLLHGHAGLSKHVELFLIIIVSDRFGLLTLLFVVHNTLKCGQDIAPYNRLFYGL